MADEKPQIFLKTCSSCGQKKPLTDFRQMSKTAGITYGTICSACRHKAKTQSDPTDDVTTTSTELEFGIKAKLQLEIDKHDLQQEIEETNKKEFEEKEKEKEEKIEKRLDIAKKEHEHRVFIKQKQASIFDSKKTQKPVTPPQKFADEKFQANKQEASKQEAQILEKDTAEKFTKEAVEKDDINLANPVLERRDNQIKYQSALFKNFATFLGKSAPLLTNIRHQLGSETQEPTPQPTTRPTTKK